MIPVNYIAEGARQGHTGHPAAPSGHPHRPPERCHGRNAFDAERIAGLSSG